MSFKFGRYQIKFDVGHFLFVSAMMGWSAWYLFDARSASLSIQNLLLIQPTVIVVAVLYLVILRDVIAVTETTPRAESVMDSESQRTLSKNWPVAESFRAPVFMLLLAIYVGSINWLGFDLATFLFITISMLMQRERRPLVLILLPLCFTAITIYGFRSMLSIPMPMFWSYFQ